ncbi:MAG: hypothetical protein HY744_11525 [Deltaproteobacteria bacterium]|nr:hypothetical protein [Deltaproteobacteria bacterium]
MSTSSTGSSSGGCADEANFQDCANCFAEENPDGANAYVQAIVDNCLCANECKEECAAECKDPNSLKDGTPCSTCFDETTAKQDSACIQGFVASCKADQSCIDFATSLQDCPE